MSLFLDGPAISFDKPSDILSAVLLLRFGDKIGEKNLKEFYDKYTVWKFLNIDFIGSANEFITGKNESNLIDYKNDYAKLFFNFGKLALIGLIDSWYELRAGDSCSTWRDYPSNNPVRGVWIENPEKRGLFYGILGRYSELAQTEMRKLSREFSIDNLDTTISPTSYLKNRIEDGLTDLSSSETIVYIISAIHSSILGFFMSSMEPAQFKELFMFNQEYKNISGDEFVKNLQSNYGFDPMKISNSLRILTIYSSLVEYVENMIGKVFNDRFSLAFKEIGNSFKKIFDNNYDLNKEDEFSYFDRIIDGSMTVQDAMVLFARELVNQSSIVYIGDNTYDIRNMYYRQINNIETQYFSTYNKLLDDNFNSEYGDIINYTSRINVKAYESIVKYSILVYRWMKKAIDEKEYDEYIINYYKLKYLEKLISNAYTYWSTNKNPFQIVGVEPMCVELDNGNGYRYKTIKDLNCIPYSVSYKRAIDLISGINARYFEAYEMKFSNSSTNGEYLKSNAVRPSDYSYDNPEDAIRAYVSGKLPYIATIGTLTPKQITVYIDTNVKDIDFDKLKKLNILDKSYVDSKKSPNLSPFEIVKSGAFDESAIGDEGVSKKLADILNNCNYYEVCWLSR